MSALVSCSPSDPPSVRTTPAQRTQLAPLSLPDPDAAPPSSDADDANQNWRDTEPGFGDELTSIAMETWVYMRPTRASTKLGYLRAGSRVARARIPASRDGCPEGFYRIEPRGYVCVGKAATLASSHAVARATPRGPRRHEAFPYQYVISRNPPPPRYVRLPSEKEQLRVEGVRAAGVSPYWQRRNAQLLGAAEPLTDFLKSGTDTPKPFGAEERVRFDTHRGRANAKSALALSATFDWTGRRFGLTTELDLIPTDRTTAVIPSEVHGVFIKGPGAPAFVMHHGVRMMEMDAGGRLKKSDVIERRAGLVLTGRSYGQDNELLEAADGRYVPASSVRVATLGTDFWGYADAGRKWIDVSIDKQMLVAYEGRQPVFATLVSTGRGGTADPEQSSATVQGTFFIQHKHITHTMDGDESRDDQFDLNDVPYVQYFHHGYALHGAYWHNEFGKARSHGCINLTPADAAWLFDWTTPIVPEGWHGVVNRKRGTLVYIHP